MCSKKKFTKTSAKLALADSLWEREAGKYKRLESRYYYCFKCNAYHLTKKGRVIEL